MKTVSTYGEMITRKLKNLWVAGLLMILSGQGIGQTTTNVTIPAGSFIIDMGIMPQTVANGLKPYGLIYALLQAKCPVEWVINPGKTKDGTDFTYNGIAYRGGPFIIKAEYRTTQVNTILAQWVGSTLVPGYGTYLGVGVKGITTTSPITVPVYLTFWDVPKWTMDKQNGIATAFFANAGIPASAYGGASTYWKLPSQLDCCDDIFVMPHADPVWLTHRKLYDWVGSGENGCKGGVWLGCHAGSALENMFDNIITDGDPIDASQQTNFLVEKTANAVGAGPWSDPGNSLILWGDHDSGTLPYTFNNTYAADPVAQYMGSTDAAQLNGSEQIYIPAHASAGWRPSTKVLVYDPDHPDAKSVPALPEYVGALLAYGPGFGVEGNGKVFLEAAHNIAGTAPANIAAQRAFFNYSFLVAWEKAVLPSISDLPDVVYSGVGYNLSYTRVANLPPEPGGNTYNTVWSASCGGQFLPNNTAASVTYIPPTAPTPLSCNISVTITDDCGRTTFDTHVVTVQCNLQVTSSITNPCYNTLNGGAITMAFSGGTGPFIYTWTRAEGGAGSGTLSAAPYIISGLLAGTYTVTATANSGAGCPVTFTVVLSSSPEILINAQAIPVGCNGASTGAINVAVSGGTPGYTYLWSDGPTTLNRSGLTAGSYTLTVLDTKGCSKQATVEVTQPDAIVITQTIAPVQCYDLNNGTINLSVTGGTGPYTYMWNDGNTSQNRTGLAPGTYSVTVTDAKNCTKTLGSLEITQPTAALSLSETHVNILCFGNSTGSIDLTVSGGTGPYTYVWTKTGSSFTASSEDIGSLTAGTYNVTVTDYRGCNATLSVVITQPAPLALTTIKVDPTCPPEQPATPPTPPALPTPPVNADGVINLTVTGGTGGYTYAWTTVDGAIPSGQSDDEDLSNLIAGTYTVVVTDANSCTATTSVTLVYLNPNPAQPAVINH